MGYGLMEWVTQLLCPSEYQSVRFVRVQNKGLALFHRLCFVGVLCYVVLYQILYQRGYQKVDTFVGTPLIKIKGAARSAEGSFYDAVDLTQPSIEESAVFVQTNSLYSRRQVRGLCAGIDTKGVAPAHISEVCGEDGYCMPNAQTQNGISTGRCIRDMCEIQSWCPLENNSESAENVLQEVGNWTLFLRVDGRYMNLLPLKSFSNFKDSELVWNLNLFYLGDIVAAAETAQTLKQVPYRKQGSSRESTDSPERLSMDYFKNIIEKGAEILVDVVWDCNLDRSIEICAPRFTFNRIDGGKGFNYRSSNEYYDQGRVYRDVTKRYGIRLVFRVQGVGRLSNIMQCTIVLGSGMGLLGIATILADVLLMYGRKNYKYQEVKFTAVEDESLMENEHI